MSFMGKKSILVIPQAEMLGGIFEDIMKFAILGCGHIATKMAAAVKAIENRGVEAYAVASRSLTKAEKFAKDYGFGRAYGSYEELAKDPAVDLI